MSLRKLAPIKRSEAMFHASKLAVSFIAISALLTGTATFAGATNKDSDPDTIEITGTGIVQELPDQASVTFAITSQQINLSAATQKNADAYVAAKKIILDEKLVESETDISTTINNNEAWEYDKDNKRVFKGWAVTKSVRLCIKDISLLGRVQDVLSTVTSVSGLQISSYSHSRAAEFELEAYSRAVADAIVKAKSAVRGTLYSVGGIKRISEVGSVGRGPIAYSASKQMAGGSEAGGGASSSVEPGVITYSKSLTVLFKLK